MVDWAWSNQPTLTVTADNTSESLKIQVINPTPAGGRPAVSSNSIWRRSTGSTGNWTLVGTVGNNGFLLDTFQRPGVSFDYFARTDTSTESITYTAVTPAVSGMWLSAAADASTLAHYPYTDGGSESISLSEQALQFVGRQYPVVEAGIQETQTLAVNAVIPFSDTDWRTQVEWWRTRIRERRTLLYRDGRGRVFACRIVGPLAFPPTRQGTTVSCTLSRVDYTASTTEIIPAYYTAGASNDQGNGVPGNGNIGNGY